MNVKQHHNDYGTRLYWIWHGMKQRCCNPNDRRYSDYGGRGIAICDEWIQYVSFKNWAIKNGYSDEFTIDRIDVDGNYCPENCRWATAKEQANNKRNNRVIEYRNQRLTIRQWAEKFNVNYDMLYSRLIKRNWTVERAFAELGGRW